MGLKRDSTRITKDCAKVPAVGSTQSQTFAALQHHNSLARMCRPQLLNDVNPHHSRSVNPYEFDRIELRFDHVHGLPNQLSFFAKVKPGVVRICLDPLDLINRTEQNSVTRPNDETLEILGFRWRLIHRPSKSFAARISSPSFDLQPGANQRFRKMFPVARL